MIEEREVLALLFGLFAFAIALRNRKSLSTLPAFSLFAAAGIVLGLGLVLTILEGLFCGSALNTIEHVSYGASSLLLALWAWSVFGRAEPPCEQARPSDDARRRDAGA